MIAAYDGWQEWLQAHFVCVRQSTLTTHVQNFAAHYGTRAEGEKITWNDRPVCIGAAIGVLGWVVPNVAIIDALGRTDWVIPRTPPPRKLGTGVAPRFVGMALPVQACSPCRAASMALLHGFSAGCVAKTADPGDDVTGDRGRR